MIVREDPRAVIVRRALVSPSYGYTPAESALNALGANGYVVVPRHLLARMADAYKADDTTALIWAARAVVEAVGPTREDGK